MEEPGEGECLWALLRSPQKCLYPPGTPTYTYARPLFDSWDVSSINEEWELIPNSRQQKAGTSSTNDCGTVQRTGKKRKLKLTLKRKSASKDNTETGRQKVCHSKGYEPASQGHKTRKGKGKASKPINPYGKEAFLIWSSDSDFQ